MIKATAPILLGLLLCGLLFSCSIFTPRASQTLTISDFRIQIENGHVLSLQDRKSNRELLLGQEAVPLLTIEVGGQNHAPSSMEWVGDDLLLSFDGSDAKVTVAVEAMPSHCSFEVVAVGSEDTIDFLTWGPYPLNINGEVGGSLGVAYDDEYAVGIMGLNLKTCGGLEHGKRDRVGNAARHMEGGSALQAYTRDRTKPRVSSNVLHNNIQAMPLAGEDVVGSKIALYGTPTSSLMDVVARIEKVEGLPHPEHDGEWLKLSPYATSSKFIMNFNPSNIDDCLTIAEQAGITCVYHPGIFETWGHFPLRKDQYPNGMPGLITCVEKAKARGLNLGAHALSNFLTPTDAFVHGTPHPNLQLAGLTTLAQDLDASSTDIHLADDAPMESYQRGKDGQWMPHYAIRIGDEIIKYGARSEQRPWVLSGCERGAFGTSAVAHSSGAQVGKMVSHGYKVFFADMQLQDEVATNLARVFNQSGMERISFDGIEGCMATGHGRYACERFIKVFYDAADNKNIINNSSDLMHQYWHYATNESWGEPWTGNFRESHLEHRLQSQELLKKDKLPTKLGQFLMRTNTTVEDIDWIMGLCAGLDSGVDFYIEPATVADNPQGAEILETIRRWESARLNGYFTEEQKQQLRDPKNVFEMTESDGKLELTFVSRWEPSDKNAD